MKPIKFYFSTDSTVKELADITHKNNVEYVKINTRLSKNLYLACTNSPDGVSAFINDLAEFHGELLGSFNFDGTQYGKSKKITNAEYNKDGKTIRTEKVNTIGAAVHDFKKTKYIDLMRDKKTHNSEGVELTSVRPTVEKETHNFFGWGGAEFPTVAEKSKT